MMKAIQKSSENTNTKTKTMTKTTTKTKTQKKCLKHPTYAIFLKSWWLTHSKYDDRYLTLAILFTPVTLVTLFRSYDQFYRAECITVSGFFGQDSPQSSRDSRQRYSRRAWCAFWPPTTPHSSCASYTTGLNIPFKSRTGYHSLTWHCGISLRQSWKTLGF